MPALVIVATEDGEQLQSPPDVASLKVVVAPAQTVVVPDIAEGGVLTETMCVR
jgi:hypothetical protein